MSYILEALRKVEQQREHIPAHGLSSRRRYYGTVTLVQKPQSLFIAGGFAASIFLVVIISVYMVVERKTAQPHQGSSVQPVPAAPEEQKASLTSIRADGLSTAPRQPSIQARLQEDRAATVRVTERDVAKLKASDKNEDSLQTKRSSAPVPHKEHARAISKTRGVKHADYRHAKNRRLASTENQSSTMPRKEDNALAKVATPSDAEPALFSSLSAQIQSRVPKMSIDGLVYSPDPGQRVVVINMKFYNEGQSTPDGVTIEAIRQNDIICSYQGQRFRLTH